MKMKHSHTEVTMTADNKTNEERKNLIAEMMKQFESNEAEVEKGQTKTAQESTFDKLTRLGKAGTLIEATQDDAYFVAYSKEGQAYPVKDFIRENIDNARFKAGKFPFFEETYLWDKDNYKGRGKPFSSGIGHKEVFLQMREGGDIEEYLSKDDFDEKKLAEYLKLADNDFKQKPLF